MASHTTPHQGQQQPQHVVQTILDSFARCFSPPLDEARGPVGVDGGGAFSRAVSRSLSSSDSRRGGAKCPLAGNAHATTNATARRQPSAEELEERSMKRKLEIFRGGKESREVGHKHAPRSRRRPHERRHNQQQHRPSKISLQTVIVGSDLVSSEEDEDETLRLAQSFRRRLACGVAPFGRGSTTTTIRGDGNAGDSNVGEGRGWGGVGSDSPISSIGKMFGDIYGRGYAASNGFLCFATPVRSASGEGGVADLDDDDLTADEFMSRHGNFVGGGRRRIDSIDGGRGVDGEGTATVDAPDSPTCCFPEEESANSTFYFDQKYSHVVQTRPPMPLFQENMLSCSDGRIDELSNMLKRRPTVCDGGGASQPRTSNMRYEYELGRNS